MPKAAEIAVISPNAELAVERPRRLGSSRSLSAVFLGDLQEDYEMHGRAIFDYVRKAFPLDYFKAMVSLSRTVRIEADVTNRFVAEKPRSREEILARVEAETGPEGRKAFEAFMNKVDQ